MADPLLSSLCTICRISIPKYTCPKCSTQTCSLPCSRRHKLWSECSGIRDPTVYKKRSELLTPSGVDHDYNFLHGIEAKIERSEKEIVDERGLVKRAELKAARNGQEPRDRNRGRGKDGKRLGDSQKNYNLSPGEQQIDKCLQLMGIRVLRAPKGMSRRTENNTNWSKNQQCINWQVEWFRSNGNERFMAKAMGNMPLGESWDAILEVERRDNMPVEEKKALKKRKAEQLKEREKATKKLRRDGQRVSDLPSIATLRLQDPETSAWNIPIPTDSPNAILEVPEQTVSRVPTDSDTKKFYLHRVPTSSPLVKVLAPLDPTIPLSDQLRKRAVFEYPTIYVFDKQANIPENYMLESDFLTQPGQKALDESGESSSEEDSDSESSSSGSDESSDEGEMSE